MSVWLQREKEKIKDVRIAIGPSGPVPKRELNTEKIFKGEIFNYDVLSMAKEQLLDETNFRTSRHRASREYRQHISGVLLENTIKTAWERADDQV